MEPGFFDEPEAAARGRPAPAAARPRPPRRRKVADTADVFAEATFVGTAPSTTHVESFRRGDLCRRPAAAGAAAAVRALAQQSRRSRACAQRCKAFLAGAGLEGKEIPDAEIEAFLLQSGKIMRAAVEGAMALLAARATAKKELRAEDRTMVASKDNNPLKLMSDPQEALAFLFDTKDRGGGFLDPVRAVGDAFEDLRAHEVALFAGMRAALLGAIQRFDPKTLEAELEKNAGGLGLNRKAKLWEQFAVFQQKLARDAEDDFNKVFGREFMGTYMAQVKQLRGGRQ